MRIRCLAAVLVVATVLPASAQLVAIPAYGSARVGPLNLHFDELISESRCPIGGVCIWEGDGVISIVVDRDGDEARSFELHTHRDFGSVAEYDGFAITLIRLEPYPTLSGFPQPEDYVATFLVFGSFVPTESTSWSAVKARF